MHGFHKHEGRVLVYPEDAARKVILSDAKCDQTASIRPLRYPDGANQWGIAERTAADAAMFVRWAAGGKLQWFRTRLPG